MASGTDNLAVKHRDAVNKLRESLHAATGQKICDGILSRYLGATRFDVKEAEEFYLINLKRRALFEFDTIAKTYVKKEWMKLVEFTTFLGFDKQNSPILYIAFGNADFFGCLNAISTFDMCLYGAYHVEFALEQQRNRLKELGQEQCEDLVVIIDFHACPFQKFGCKYTMESGLDLLKKFQDIQPGVLKWLIFVNVPFYFATFISLFQPILALETLRKVLVFSKESTARGLLKFIDAETLPAFLGGNRVDENGDPRCSSFIRFGSKVPRKVYAINAPMLNLSDIGVSELTIQAGSVREVSVYVEKPGSRLKVEFRGQHTIAFWVLFRRKNISSQESSDGCDAAHEHPTEELLKGLKVQCHLAPLCHAFYCSRTGIYTCRFDNTCSWRTIKRIIYRIQVLSPTSEL